MRSVWHGRSRVRIVTGDDDFGLDDAYALETPDDARRLYAAWADT